MVQEQLDAYNARDLERFLACFADDVRAFRLPSLEPTLDGKKAFGDFYAVHRFQRPGLHADLIGRMVLGGKVIDHERIHGIADEPVEMAMIYLVEDGLIRQTFAVPR